MTYATVKIVISDYVKADGTSNLRLRLTIDRRTKYFPLNVFVKPKQFVSGKVSKGDSKHIRKNNLIYKSFNKANDIIYNFRINDIPITFDNFEIDFTNKVYGSKSFYEFVDHLREELKEKLAPETIKGYKDQSNKLKAFRSTLKFKDIDKRFIDQYELYMIGLGNNGNTITKSKKFIQNILNKAKGQGLIKDNVFDSIKLGRTDGNREFLTLQELNQIDELYYKGELKANKNNVLRYFLFCCYTGLRYSDVRNLKFEDIHDDRYISIKMHKTKEPVLIPLIDKAKKLLPKKYFAKQKVFKVLTDQPTNRYLKDIMTHAKINKSISFHCSRHTFATLSKSQGMEYDVISKILGHTDIKTTRIYTKYELTHLEKEMNKWKDYTA